MSSPVTASRFSTAQLASLLALRPGRSATLVAAALGLPLPAAPPGPRSDADLPRGESAVVGDVLTAADVLVSIGTADALAALVAVGRDRVLLVAPDGHGVEVAALDGGASVGAAVAEVAGRVGPGAVVVLAAGADGIHPLDVGPDLAASVSALVRRATR